MLKDFKILISLLLVSFYTVAYAYDDLHLECQLTPEIWTLTPFEGKIVKSNNLRHKTGSAYFADGEFINIHGTILDSNCVPITEAVIEIWQADALGNLPSPYNLLDLDKHFSYSGTAISDNLGRFTFFTIFPGEGEHEAPKIHFRVRHADFLPFETFMYFPDNKYNKFDHDFQKLVDKSKKSLLTFSYVDANSAPATYNFNITLQGVNKYKRY